MSVYAKFWPKKFWDQKKISKKILGPKKILKKIFGPKKNFGLKNNFGSEKVLIRHFFGTNKISGLKILGP